MPERTSYPQGTPNWTELRTTDREGAKSFYGRLFGWRFDDVTGYAFTDDGIVAGIAAQPPDTAPAWITYFAVDDIDAVAAVVPAAGGTLQAGPYEVTDAGRAALATDPTGALAGLWQAGRHIGATVVNEPGAPGWSELLTDDVDAAVAFYRRVLGLVPEAADLDGVPWTVLRAGTDAVAGVVRKPSESIPNRWGVYFTTADVAATIRRAAEIGGTVLVGPVDTPIGPMGGVQDRQGARFSIWTFVPPAGP